MGTGYEVINWEMISHGTYNYFVIELRLFSF